MRQVWADGLTWERVVTPWRLLVWCQDGDKASLFKKLASLSKLAAKGTKLSVFNCWTLLRRGKVWPPSLTTPSPSSLPF